MTSELLFFVAIIVLSTPHNLLDCIPEFLRQLAL